jgi:hypothetical protein
MSQQHAKGMSHVLSLRGSALLERILLIKSKLEAGYSLSSPSFDFLVAASNEIGDYVRHIRTSGTEDQNRHLLSPLALLRRTVDLALQNQRQNLPEEP